MSSELLSPGMQVLRMLWICFPFIPAAALTCSMFAQYLLHRDWSLGFCRLSAVMQIICASVITVTAATLDLPSLMMNLMDSTISITFLYAPEKLFFLWALIIPMVLSLFKLREIDSFSMRMILLFYLTGCSGLVVTGDIFNFFVFYELMIMGAYVLISVKGAYSASVKYMIFGAASSALFLGGVVVLYASGAYFRFDFASSSAPLSETAVTIALLLFTTAFFIKGAFFPVSGWVAPCHSAANSLVSAFLASFTIFSSIIGLYYIVLLPAEALSIDGLFSLVRVLSLLTIAGGAVILFWESSFKRSIAASTVFSIGITGLLLSYRLYVPACCYVLVHGGYKSLLFHLHDDILDEGDSITIGGLSLAVLAIAVIFAAGYSPALTGLIKEILYPLMPSWYTWLFLFSGALVIGGFAKFRYTVVLRQMPSETVISALLLSAGAAWAMFTWDLASPQLDFSLAAEAAAAAAALAAARRIYSRFTLLQNLERKSVYRNLNQELLLIVLLVQGSLLFLRFF